MEPRIPTLVALHAADVSLVLDVTGVPAVVHWGARLPELDEASERALLRATGRPLFVPNGPDAPVRLSIVPEAASGWQGRPGLTGSRSGADAWPRWSVASVRCGDGSLSGTSASVGGGDGSLSGTSASVGGDNRSLSRTPEASVSKGPTQAGVANLGVSASEPAADNIRALLVRQSTEKRTHVGGVVEVDLVDDATRLALTVTVELTAEGLVRLRARLTNTGDSPYELRELLLALPVPERAREGLDFGGRWLKERHPQRWTLDQGTRWREARHGRTGADAAHVLHVGTPGFGFADGEVWAVHTAWSGNHVHYAERSLIGDQVIGGGELLLPGEGELAPGASYETPWLFASYGRGLDAVAHRFHGWLRRTPRRPRPVTLNCWEAVYFDHSLERLSALAEAGASVGVERFVLDDGWFGARRNDTLGLGDWTVSPAVWPEGLTPLIDRVNALGMEFGLWVEPEMVNLDSDVARAHPEWLMQPGHGRLPVESRHQHVLNLSLPDAYAHVRDQLMAILDAHDIAYLKWDHNRDLVESGTAPDGRPAVHAQTLATYRLMDELKAAHPGLEIESCSSGGARVDLEIMARADRVWVSDCIDPHERAESQRWTAQLLAPELMGTHIASGRSHTTQRQHDLSFRAASALWGHLGIEWDLTAASEAELTELRAWVALHKAWRDVLHAGRVVRAEDRDGLCVHGVVTDARALFFVGLLELPPVLGLGRVTFPGLDADARYRVQAVSPGLPEGTVPAPWMMDAEGPVLSGAVLGSVGLQCPILAVDHALVLGLTRL